jgi:MFS family permease
VVGAGRRTAVRRWAVAVGVYLVAVFHRTSLGVAGLLAEQRFGIGPSALSTFVMLQLGVYAAMQIPTGILVDRFGPRRLLIVAATTLGFAQLAFAVVHSYPAALLARGVLGCGDALTFVSVLRFAAGQFNPRRYPLVVAATVTIGTLGNVVATVPLTSLLHTAGWTVTFALAGAASLVSGVAVFFVLPRTRSIAPGVRAPGEHRSGLRRVAARTATAWRRPGTKLGFWVHFTSMSTAVTFGVLWGVPFLVEGEGMSATEASTVLLGSVLVSLFAGPAVGYLTGRYRAARVPLAIASAAVTVAGWYALLVFFPTPAPPVLLIGLILLTALGGPISAVGFALARDYNGPAVLGTATGVVNVGGFVAAILGSLAIGWTLDLAGSTALSAYRWAWAFAVTIQALGLAQMVRWWLRARRSVLAAQDRGESTPVAIIRHRWDLSERAGQG